MYEKIISNSHLPALLLRVGLGIVFLYAAIDSLVHPNDWIGFLPSLLADRLSADLLLTGFSGYQLFLAVWLFSGVYLRYAAFLAAATLAGIILFNTSLLLITFRDIALLFAALALAVLAIQAKK